MSAENLPETSSENPLKISGILGNGELHAIVPAIREAFEREVHPEQYKEAYQSLVDAFTEFYAIDKLTFNQFSTLLKSIDNPDKPATLQIVMGPVLRQFMAKREQEQDRRQALTALQHNGHYSRLSAAQVIKYVGNPLGIECTPIAISEAYTTGDNPASLYRACDEGIQTAITILLGSELKNDTQRGFNELKRFIEPLAGEALSTIENHSGFFNRSDESNADEVSCPRLLM